MAEKKISITNKVFIIVLLCLLLAIFSCASQVKQTPQMDSVHYVAQVQPQGYSCPECSFPIPDKNVSPNIRIENKCPNCGKIFFGVPVVNKTQEYKGNRGEKVASSELKSHGPRSIYEANTDYQSFWIGGESFNETETGYSLLSWGFGDRKVKSRRVTPHWTNTRYNLVGR